MHKLYAKLWEHSTALTLGPTLLVDRRHIQRNTPTAERMNVASKTAIKVGCHHSKDDSVVDGPAVADDPAGVGSNEGIFVLLVGTLIADSFPSEIDGAVGEGVRRGSDGLEEGA